MSENPDDEIRVLFVTRNGYGKCTALSDFRVQARGGVGAKGLLVTPKGGDVVVSLMIGQSTDLFIITAKGKVIRFSPNEIRTTVKDSSGVRVITLADDDYVVSAFEVL